MIGTRALLGIPLAVLAAWPGGPAATAPAQESGADLFRSYCAGCHTLGGGDAVGPDLLGIHERREEAWLRAWVASPAALAASDPDARDLVERWGFPMPSLGLDEASVDAVLAYVRSVSTGDAPAPTGSDGRPGMGRGPGPHGGPPPGMGSAGRGHRGHHGPHDRRGGHACHRGGGSDREAGGGAPAG